MEDFFFFVLLPALVIGVAAIGSCTKHTEKMECTKQRGEWVNDACKFPDSKPAVPR